mmetsp:Transcript_12373/g.21677  ORF Transcript_12373/g.21677 Transcript_12373/m.21677 type:complete len:153 (+) Transcript_12373:52-510(+)
MLRHNTSICPSRSIDYQDLFKIRCHRITPPLSRRSMLTLKPNVLTVRPVSSVSAPLRTRPRPCQIESIGKDGVPYVPLNLTGLGQDEEHTVDHCYSRSLYYKGSTAVNVTTNDMRSLTGVASGAQYVSRNPSTNPTMGDWCFAWFLALLRWN